MKLGEILEEQWDVSPPEAIIAITGISHQFNIKDKRSLKKELVKAVVSTGNICIKRIETFISSLMANVFFSSSLIKTCLY